MTDEERRRLSSPMRFGTIIQGPPPPPHLRTAFEPFVGETETTGVEAVFEALLKAGTPVKRGKS